MSACTLSFGYFSQEINPKHEVVLLPWLSGRFDIFEYVCWHLFQVLTNRNSLSLKTWFYLVQNDLLILHRGLPIQSLLVVNIKPFLWTKISHICTSKDCNSKTFQNFWKYGSSLHNSLIVLNTITFRYGTYWEHPQQHFELSPYV